MMHAWIWSPNPEGIFAADNWLIPLLRLDLTPPAEFSVAAAKALYGDGSPEYNAVNKAWKAVDVTP